MPCRFSLRPYQRECIAAIPESGRYLVYMATGLGKTVTFSQIPRRGRALILSHREELVNQPRKYYDCPFGVEMAGQRSNGEDVVSASVQSLARRLGRFRPDDFDIIISDECFPAGTLVDGTPIERVVLGQSVLSLNHQTGEIEKRQVTRLFKRPVNKLVKISFTDGQCIHCTPSHPFYAVEERGYVNAINLKNGAAVIQMPLVRANGGSGDEAPKIYAPQGGARLLLEGMRDEIQCRDLVKDDGGDESKIRIRENEGTQPDDEAGIPREDEGNVEANRARPNHARRKREGADEAPGNSPGCVEEDFPDSGIYSADEAAKGIGFPYALQDRHCDPCVQYCHRNRRKQPCPSQQAGKGQKEGFFFEILRVDSVEDIEPASHDGIAADGFVYNIEVEGNNNYFANGILVHNCHHAAAPTYRKIYEYFRPRLHLGFTATPNRNDGIGLEQVFDDIVFERDLEWGIRNGWLSPIECLRADIGYDLRGVATRMGDYSPAELEKAVSVEGANKAIAEAYAKYAKGQTLVFACSVAHARAIAAEIPGAVAVAGGEERAETLEAFAKGGIRCIVNCMVFSEGTDLPCVETVMIARPTQNVSLYTQMIGRGTRVYPGKEKMRLIDCVGSCDDINICTAPSLLGLDLKLVERKEKVEGDLFDLPEIVKRETDKPECWVRNAEYVDLWAKGRKYNTRGVAYFRMPDGSLLLLKPRFRIPPEDSLGRTLWNGKKERTQKVLDEVYRSLRDNYDDMRQLWDLSNVRRWGAYQATEKQMGIVRRFWPYAPDLTKLQAAQVIARCFAG